MKLKKPFIGIIAFLIVLFTMPLGHAVMILMEKGLGHEYIYPAAVIMGFVGLIFLIIGYLSTKETAATFWGLFAGLFIWTGWVEFAFVYYANRYGIPPLMENGEIVTKPEYLLMPSSLPFLAIFFTYYFLGSKTGCTFFNWFQRKLKISKIKNYQPANRSIALTTMMELIMLLWTFYMLLLFAYDKNFFGDRHFFTYIVAFGSLFWSIWLFVKLIKKENFAYALRYAIPTVIIFWNFVEILGRWDFFKEIWVEPAKYSTELILMTLVFVALTLIGIIGKNKKHK